METAPALPEQEVRLYEDESGFTIENGLLRIRILRNGFDLIHQAWLDLDGDGEFASSEAMLNTESPAHGATLFAADATEEDDRDRAELSIEIEEAGPVRASIRIAANTRQSGDSLQHGFAARIYVWADSSAVKIDYQLQNSLLDPRGGGPLYFEGLDLRIPTSSAPDAVVRAVVDGESVEGGIGNALLLAQRSHDRASLSVGSASREVETSAQARAFVDVSDDRGGVAIMPRYWAEQWPNGLSVDDEGVVSAELFPRWSATWDERANAESPSGLYWLEDMQHVYKELLVVFHGPDVPSEDLLAMARTLSFHPVARIPYEWHQAASASLDMGGLIPDAEEPPDGVRRVPAYAEDELDERYPFTG